MKSNQLLALILALLLYLMKKATITPVFLLLYLFFPISLIAQHSVSLKITQAPGLTLSSLPDLTYTGESTQLGKADMVSGGSGEYFYHWEPEEGLDDPNVARPIARPEEDITYTLTVIDGNGCSVLTTQAISVDFTQIDMHIQRTSLNVYPNPGNGKFKIEIDGYISGESSIWITNMLGELIHEINEVPVGENISINCRLDYPPGIYQLFLRTEEGIFNTSIVIQ